MDVADFDSGEVTGTDLNDFGGTGQYRFLETHNLALQTLLRGKFRKIPGINTVTIHARIWQSFSALNMDTNQVRVTIGGQFNTVSVVGVESPTWATPQNIDVSSLTDGVTYDITVQMMTDDPMDPSRMGALFLIGS